jgi:polysaccharide biosynthesis transport protein
MAPLASAPRSHRLPRNPFRYARTRSETGKRNIFPQYAVVLPSPAADNDASDNLGLMGNSHPLNSPRREHKPSFLRQITILRRHWWKIAAFVLLAIALTGYLSERMQPMYESTALIDADKQATSGVIGEEAARSNSTGDTDEFLATQVKIMQSDAVLRPVAEKYGLLAVEHQFAGVGPAKRWMVGNAPIELKQLKIARSPRTHLLYISYRSSDPKLAADVANAIANSYIEHTYNTRARAAEGLSSFMEMQLGELKAKMERSKQALAQFESELNVIDPEEKSNILSARLLQLNTEYTKAQADRVGKEAAHESMQKGSLAAAQVSTQGEALVKLSERLNSSREVFASVKSIYGVNHPEYRKAATQLEEITRQFEDTKKNIAQRIDVEYQQAVDREHMLRQSVAETKADLDRLSSRSMDYRQLKHEAEADTKLYEELVRKIREASLNAGFRGEAVRIADLARPPARPVTPNKPLNMVLAMLGSTILAIGGVFLSEILNARIHNPDQVQQSLNPRLVATLPNVRRLAEAPYSQPEPWSLTNFRRAEPPKEELIRYEESIRRLRNSILLSETGQPIHSLLVTSGLAGEGKSTTAVHLAISRANQRKRTLLIDADLRRPTLHDRLALGDGPGLANVLAGALAFRDAICSVPEVPDLHVMRAGQASSRASDLVGPAILDLLHDAAADYDLVIVDAPPLLAFAESLQIATAVDGVLVITRAGSTSLEAVSTVLTTLYGLQANIIGVVLNRFRGDRNSQYGDVDRKYYASNGIKPGGFASAI